MIDVMQVGVKAKNVKCLEKNSDGYFIRRYLGKTVGLQRNGYLFSATSPACL